MEGLEFGVKSFGFHLQDMGSGKHFKGFLWESDMLRIVSGRLILLIGC